MEIAKLCNMIMILCDGIKEKTENEENSEIFKNHVEEAMKHITNIYHLLAK